MVEYKHMSNYFVSYLVHWCVGKSHTMANVLAHALATYSGIFQHSLHKQGVIKFKMAAVC
jgi:hypothetical protein